MGCNPKLIWNVSIVAALMLCKRALRVRRAKINRTIDPKIILNTENIRCATMGCLSLTAIWSVNKQMCRGSLNFKLPANKQTYTNFLQMTYSNWVNVNTKMKHIFSAWKFIHDHGVIEIMVCLPQRIRCSHRYCLAFARCKRDQCNSKSRWLTRGSK